MSKICTYIFGTLLIISFLGLFNIVIILGAKTPAWLVAVLLSANVLFIVGLAISLAKQEEK